jgi:peptide/nickel transport system ATP-binding protein
VSEPLIRVEGLEKTFAPHSKFGRDAEPVRAVDGVDLKVHASEMVGLVGESGSGKTTLGQCLLRMQEPSAGSVDFDGRDLLAVSKQDLAPLRPRMQYIFQDPYSALNPRLPVADAIGEPLLHHGLATKADVRDRVVSARETAGLDGSAIDRYPHEFSGGQRQRIVIARAMALEPEFVVADEPASALDVSIQAQIINLFSELRETRRTAFVFISHDLGVVEHLCTSVAIMYKGRIVEQGTRDQVFDDPRHPYTHELLAAVPLPDPRQRRRGASRRVREWDVPRSQRPALADVGDGHLVALP